MQAHSKAGRVSLEVANMRMRTEQRGLPISVLFTKLKDTVSFTVDPDMKSNRVTGSVHKKENLFPYRIDSHMK